MILRQFNELTCNLVDNLLHLRTIWLCELTLNGFFSTSCWRSKFCNVYYFSAICKPLTLGIGTANAGCLDGPASKAQLLEPTGLCFDGDTALFCCFGGSKAGYIRVHTRVDFACRFMSIIRQIYHSIGFLPKKENHLAQIGRKHTAPLVEGTNNLIDSLANLEGFIAQRKDYLKIARAGPEGTVCHKELIKKTCQCPHSYQTNSFSAYQSTHSSGLSCVETIVQYKKWSEKFAPLQV